MNFNLTRLDREILLPYADTMKGGLTLQFLTQSEGGCIKVAIYKEAAKPTPSSRKDATR